MNNSVRSHMLSQVSHLIEKELYSSAENLCSFILSSMDSSPSLESAMVFELYGDALYGKEEFKRALGAYGDAIRHRILASGHRKIYYKNEAIDSEAESIIRHKESQCYLMLKDPSAALRELETIPQRFRDAKINSTIGKLYRNTGLRRHAIVAYKEALSQLPTAIEVMEALAALGVDAREILGIIDESCAKNSTFQSIFSGNWHYRLVNSLSNRYKGEFEGIFLKINYIYVNY